MEPENTQYKKVQENKINISNTTTPILKYLATALIIVLLFVGIWIGYKNTSEKTAEVGSFAETGEVVEIYNITTAEDFEILLSEDFNPEKTSFYGVMLNQPISEVSITNGNVEENYGNQIYETQYADLSLFVVDDRVAEIRIRNNILKNLKLTSRENIVELLGEPRSLESEMSTATYNYPSKNMVVFIVDGNPFSEAVEEKSKKIDPVLLMKIQSRY